jgi:uncharacterized membrane protein YGL010W
MPDGNARFADYASYHRTAGNKWFHRFGIPMIMLSLIGMLTRVEIFSIHSFRIDLAMVLILASSVYYLALEWRLGLAMLGVSIIFYVAGAALPFSVNLALFILGWIFQFVGDH